jgi:hypothetical protein
MEVFMGFLKQGSPQAMTVVSSDGMCELCHQKKASVYANGKMVCDTCNSSKVDEEKTNVQ